MNLNITLRFYTIVLEFLISKSFNHNLNKKASELIDEINNLPDKTK